MPGKRTDPDVVVVGGGPAGLAVAIRARQAGMRVVVLDRAEPPIDKACGEGLMPDGAERLRLLGVEPPASGHAVFRGIRYVDGDVTAEGRFLGAEGLGVRRSALHGAMALRAREVGVELRWGVSARGLDGDGVRTDRGTISGRFIVGADGLHSRVRTWAGFPVRTGPRRRYGIRRHYTLRPWTDLVEVHWGSGCEAYVTPTGPSRVGVALLWGGGGEGFDSLLDRFPTLRSRLGGAPCESAARGAGPLLQRVRGVARGRVALVGDASGYVDAITGEGLSLAFHQAFALVDAIRAGDPRRYERAHRRLGRLPGAMTHLLLWVERRPAVRRRLIRALAADPELFSGLLSVHAGSLPPRRLGPAAARLALRVVSA
jgi:flavin-dependent dehydrogenase